jgi:hypothetical protein
VVWALQIGTVGFGVLPVSLFLALGQRVLGRGRGLLPGVAAALVAGAGLSLNNAAAVLAGLGAARGEWERTPKRGEPRTAGDASHYRPARRRGGHAETALAIYFGGLAAFVCGARDYRALPFVLLLVAGFAAVGWSSLAATGGGGSASGKGRGSARPAGAPGTVARAG